MSTILENAYNMWNEWEIRILVLLSLFLQIMLILLGSRRNYVVGSWISNLVWLSYLLADSVATLSLGILARNEYHGQVNNIESNDDLMALWAPFLVLHLGGPDTITAYSLEDNELWTRHLLGLLTQVTMAFYILYKFWTSAALSYIYFPILVAGMFKYGERTWVLYSASMKKFRSSILSGDSIQQLQASHNNAYISDLLESYYLFERHLKYLFADLNLREKGFKSSKGAKFDFKQVELELKFLYDVLYTKAPINFTVAGLCLRIICSLALISALLVFIIVVDKHMYMKPNVYVTCCLLVGSVILDIWAFIAFLLSDWTKVWLTRHKSMFPDGVYRLAMSCGASNREKRKWSRQVPQHSLIDFCIRNKDAKCLRSEIMFKLTFELKTQWDVKWEYVDDDMIDIIYNKVLEKHEELMNTEPNRSFNDIVDGILRRREGNLFAKYNIQNLNTEELEFNYSVIVWHVTTTICFYLYDDQDDGETSKQRIISKKLSEYIFYLVLMSPTLMPKWYGGVRIMEESYMLALSYFREEKKVSSGRKETIMTLLESQKSFDGVHSSTLEFGRSIAKQLGRTERRWSFLCDLWTAMLIYAAGQCGWREHAQRLPFGGELLTHVSLIMANYGLTYHYSG